MLAPLSTRPQQHMCKHDENQLLKSCHKVRDVATPKMQVHYVMYELIISPKFKFLAMVVSKFL